MIERTQWNISYQSLFPIKSLSFVLTLFIPFIPEPRNCINDSNVYLGSKWRTSDPPRSLKQITKYNKNTNMDVGNTLYSISNIFEIKNGNWSRGHGQRDQRIKRRRRRRRRRRKNQRWCENCVRAENVVSRGCLARKFRLAKSFRGNLART